MNSPIVKSILAVANQKGGVGKSTTALALVAGLQKRRKVLVIDLDPQGNLTSTLGADGSTGGALEAINYPKEARDYIQHTDGGDILPSTPGLSGADLTFTGNGKEYLLREALATVAKDYDYCIIDTPPALGILTVNALAAAHGVIIPTQADVYSLQGLGQLAATIAAVKEYANPKLSIMGVLLTRHNPRAIIRREAAETLRDTARQLGSKVYKHFIRECTALVEAQAVREDIFTYAPKSNAAQDYGDFIREVIKDTLHP